jgi:FMN hydrolase / 5-amino-6-(5-phospho-D-ribitylamino)uracil phosphatase
VLEQNQSNIKLQGTLGRCTHFAKAFDVTRVGGHTELIKLKLVRFVWFDLDDTLYDFQAMMRYALKAPLQLIHQIYPHTTETLDVEAMVEVRKKVSLQHQDPGWTLERLRLHAFQETLRQYAEPNETLANKLQNLYLKARFRDIRPFADVLPCLSLLRDKFILGLLSNGNSSAKQIGLESFFALSVFSEEIGICKPDIRIFNRAAQLARYKPEQCLYVGDSPEHDVAGAFRAGWQVVWLNRNERSWTLSSPASPLQVTSLAALPSLLE